ncbi:MAG: hypothetical protein ACRD2E_10430 [Terriglobales bacterium]
MVVDTLDPDDDDGEYGTDPDDAPTPPVTEQGEDPRLLHVDLRHRAEVAHFQRADEAEFAAGMLRANGIPAEVQAMMIPGLTADLALWVPRDHEELARRLLREAEEGDFAE